MHRTKVRDQYAREVIDFSLAAFMQDSITDNITAPLPLQQSHSSSFTSFAMGVSPYQALRYEYGASSSSAGHFSHMQSPIYNILR